MMNSNQIAGSASLGQAQRHCDDARRVAPPTTEDRVGTNWLSDQILAELERLDNDLTVLTDRLECVSTSVGSADSGPAGAYLGEAVFGCQVNDRLQKGVAFIRQFQSVVQRLTTRLAL